MATRFLYAGARLLALCLAAAGGYMAVYVPLLNLLFDKRHPEVFLPILALSIFAAYKCAQFADRRLPRLKPQREA